MNLTKNFRFRKPEGTDPINIEDFNDNFDLIDEELKKRPTDTGEISDAFVDFTKASERANVAPKESLAVLFGKIMKTFADLKNVAFSGSYKDLVETPALGTGAGAVVIESVNDLAAVTEEGYVVGGKAGAQIINNLKGFTPITDASGKITGYKTKAGADTVFPFSSLSSAAFTKIIESNMINGVGANGSYTFARDCPLVLCFWVGFHQSNYTEDTARYALAGTHGAIDTLIARRDHYTSSWTMEIKLMAVRDIKTGATLAMSFSGAHHMSYVCAHAVQ